ncbi:MAG: zinc ribbon domain-containing protein [Novosphingobium sp.]|nr:zinc ribbon domain-containing protein [Novosphingobium sp.]
MHERIQEQLRAGTRAAFRADISADFPLRGHVACAQCGKPLTSCWSTPRNGNKHPYYMCFWKACPRYRKSIRRDQLEGAFVKLLDRLTPSQRLVDLAGAMFRDAWGQREALARAVRQEQGHEVTKVQKQMETLLDRILEASSPAVIVAYEKRIAELEKVLLVLEEKQRAGAPRQGTFEELFELAMRYLASPSKIWKMGKIEYQKLVLRLTFAERLLWCPESGFRTAKTSLPFKMLDAFESGEKEMAHPTGFEPVAPRLGI